MKPERAQELYSDYAEGLLSPALKQAMDQHFEANPDARAEYKAFVVVFRLLNSYVPEEVEVPLGFRAKALERVSALQSAREVPSSSAARSPFSAWFRGRRQLAGAVAAFAAVCLVVGIAFAPHSSDNTSTATFGPAFPISSSAVSTLAGVTTSQDNSGSHFSFEVHLPATVPSATVSAYILSDNDQITDPELLSQATSALTPPETLTDQESMTIPVTVEAATAPGTTLNMLVQWTPTGSQTTDSQVIFTPTQPGASVASPTPLPANSGYYDALQAIAADDDVTVIADASAAPTQGVTVTPADSASQALTDLQNVAGQVGYSVQHLPSGAYLVAPAQS